MLQNNPELKSKINQLWDKFWAGGISNPLTAIEQITYLLFMKRIDRLDQERQAGAEWAGEPFSSKFEGTWIPPEYRAKLSDNDTEKEKKRKLEEENKYAIERRTLRWSEFKRMQAEEMLQHVQTKVFPFLKDMNGAASNFTRHMKNAVFIIPKPGCWWKRSRPSMRSSKLWRRIHGITARPFRISRATSMKCCSPKSPAPARTASSVRRAT